MRFAMTSIQGLMAAVAGLGLAACLGTAPVHAQTGNPGGAINDNLGDDGLRRLPWDRSQVLP
jgi:hypothetical protein